MKRQPALMYHQDAFCAWADFCRHERLSDKPVAYTATRQLTAVLCACRFWQLWTQPLLRM
jgi:nitrite reductase/ring-hydroxylating ferredoxin subunit